MRSKWAHSLECEVWNLSEPTHEHARVRSMNDDDLELLSRVRERVAPEHHHQETLARTIESWWGVTDGDEMISSYGVEACQFAHEKMQGFEPETLDSISNLGGYFRHVAKTNIPGGGAKLLGRSAPHMKRKRDAEQQATAAEEAARERREFAANTPGTLEYRIRHGGNDG